MSDQIKKIGFWIGIFPLILTMWGTISMTVYHVDVIIRIVELAAEKDEYDKNGLDKYLIMYRQHQVLWQDYTQEHD